MKDKTISFLLSAFQIIIDFGILISILVVALIGLMDLVTIIGQPHDVVETFGSANVGIQIVEWIDGLVMAVLTIIMATGMSSIIRNINDKSYFVTANLTALRRILWTTTTIFIIQVVNGLFFKLANIKDVDKFFTFHGNDFDNSIIFIVTIFLIYLVFKRGLALQKEVDSII